MYLVEEKFGLDTLEQLFPDTDDERFYTAVGSYDHKDLVRLIMQFSKQTGIAVKELQRVFG